jgi:hypothetical protein
MLEQHQKPPLLKLTQALSFRNGTFWNELHAANFNGTILEGLDINTKYPPYANLLGVLQFRSGQALVVARFSDCWIIRFKDTVSMRQVAELKRQMSWLSHLADDSLCQISLKQIGLLNLTLKGLEESFGPAAAPDWNWVQEQDIRQFIGWFSCVSLVN